MRNKISGKLEITGPLGHGQQTATEEWLRRLDVKFDITDLTPNGTIVSFHGEGFEIIIDKEKPYKE